ncbi:hypothetical protein, partial [Streptococcus dysgalactiae]|uniref:hypothetical protein n=1 Tax=Streptococcus dysgalactiae TaxID=1334 RepID=UPI0019511082
MAKKQFTKMRNDIDILNTIITPLDKLFTLLLPLTYFLEPTSQPSQSNLVSASKFLDSIVSEVAKRMNCSNNAVVFNIPDRIPLETTKSLILQACGMENTQCHCIRLRKISQRYNCALLFQFSNARVAETFIRNRQRREERTSWEGIKKGNEKTPRKREVGKIASECQQVKVASVSLKP